MKIKDGQDVWLLFLVGMVIILFFVFMGKEIGSIKNLIATVEILITALAKTAIIATVYIGLVFFVIKTGYRKK